jgi:transposase
MAEAYDVTFRERAVRAYEAGKGGVHRLAAVFEIGYRTLQRWVAQQRATGSVEPRPKGGGWRCPIDMPTLTALVTEAPDSTLAELCWEYNRQVPAAQRSSPTSVGRALHRADFVCKKNGRGRAKWIGRTSRRSGGRS